MRKYIIFLVTLFYSFNCVAQTTDTVAAYRSNGLLKKVIYNHYTLPNTPLGYFTPYGTFGKLYDTARAAMGIAFTTTGTSGAATGTYSNATGIFSFNIPQYAGSGGGAGWALTGNSATDSSVNFLGTTDNRRVMLGQNNISRGYIDRNGLVLNGFDLSATAGVELPLKLINKVTTSAVGISLKQSSGSGAEYRITSNNDGTMSLGWYYPSLDQTFASITLSSFGAVAFGNATTVSLQSTSYLGTYGASPTIEKKGLTFSLENSGANTLINSSGSFSYLSPIPLVVRALSLSVSDAGTVANASAKLHISSTNQGVLLTPMTTTQRDSILSPAEGLEVYNTTTHTKEYRNNSVWKNVASPIVITTTQKNTGPVGTGSLNSGGTGYNPPGSNTILATGGTGTGAKLIIIVNSGVITGVTIAYGGTGYTVSDILSYGGGGSGFSYTISTITPPSIGTTIFCSDCTATDSSTGVTQTYTSSGWKNNW